MSDTPRTDAMLQPVDGRDCVTGEPITVVHADDCRALERELAAVANKCAALTTALSFAQGAISDAIYTEDGLDGDAGQRVLAITHEAIEHGTFDERAYEELACMDAASQHIDALENLSAATAEIAQLRAELEAREAEVARLLDEVREWKAEHASMAEHLAASRDEHMTRIRRELSDNDRRLRINDLAARYAGELAYAFKGDGWPGKTAAAARALAAAVVEAEE